MPARLPILLPLLLLLLTVFFVSSTHAVRRNRRNPRAKPKKATPPHTGSPTIALGPRGEPSATASPSTAPTFKVDSSFLYQPSSVSFAPCSWSLYRQTALNCASGNDGVVGDLVRVGAKQDWLTTCADACAALTTSGTTCTGFVYRGKNFNVKAFQNTCTFRSCSENVDGTLSGVNNDVVTVVLQTPRCLFSAAPTSSPTTPKPSARPSRRPTPKPTYYTTRSPTTLAPTSSPGPDPIDRSRFTAIRTDLSMCVIVRVPLSVASYVYNDWTGSELDCLSKCAYDKMCGGVMYSAVLKQCVKAVSLETYDDPSKLAQYKAAKWKAYTVDDKTVPYFNQYCSIYVWSKACKADPSCAWNGGLKGYNDIHILDRGYCGRVACAAGASSSSG